MARHRTRFRFRRTRASSSRRGIKRRNIRRRSRRARSMGKRKLARTRRLRVTQVPRSAFRPAPAKGDEINLMPKSKIVTLYYSQLGISLRRTLGGGFTTKKFSVNGLFDVDLSGSGHQPYLFDQYMAIYQKYDVLASKITVTQVMGTPQDVNNEQGDVTLLMGNHKHYLQANANEAVTGGMHSALCEQGIHPKQHYNLHAIPLANSIARVPLKLLKLTSSWSKGPSVKRVKLIQDRGSTSSEPQKFWGDIANNPDQPSDALGEQFRLTFSSANGIQASPGFAFGVCIAYRVRFSDLKGVAAS